MPMNVEVQHIDIAQELKNPKTAAERALDSRGNFRENLVKADGAEAHTALAKLHVLKEFLTGEEKEKPQFSLLNKAEIEDAIDVLQNLRTVLQDLPTYLNRQSSEFRRAKEQTLLQEISANSTAQLAQIESQLGNLNRLLTKATDFDQLLTTVDLIDTQSQNYDRGDQLAEDARLGEFKREEARQQQNLPKPEAPASRFTAKLKIQLATIAMALSIAPTAVAQDGLPTVTEIVEHASALASEAFKQISQTIQSLNMTASSLLNGMEESITSRMAAVGILQPVTTEINIPLAGGITTEVSTGEYRLPSLELGLQRAFLGAFATEAQAAQSEAQSATADNVAEVLAQTNPEDPRDVLGVETAQVTAETSPFLHNLLETQFNASSAEFAQLNIQFEVADGQASFYIGDQGPLTYSDLQLTEGSEIESRFTRITSSMLFAQNEQTPDPVGRQQIELVAQRGADNQFSAALALRVLNQFNFPFVERSIPLETNALVIQRPEGANYKIPIEGSTIELLPVNQEMLDILSQYSELSDRDFPQIGENIVAEIIELPNEAGEYVRVPVSILGNGEVIDISSSYRVVPREAVSQGVNIRRGPGTQFEIMGVLNNDSVDNPTPMPTATPDLPESGDLWLTVLWNGETGFISADFAKIEGLPEKGLPKVAVVEAAAGGTNLEIAPARTRLVMKGDILPDAVVFSEPVPGSTSYGLVSDVGEISIILNQEQTGPLLTPTQFNVNMIEIVDGLGRRGWISEQSATNLRVIEETIRHNSNEFTIITDNENRHGLEFQRPSGGTVRLLTGISRLDIASVNIEKFDENLQRVAAPNGNLTFNIDLFSQVNSETRESWAANGNAGINLSRDSRTEGDTLVYTIGVSQEYLNHYNHNAPITDSVDVEDNVTENIAGLLVEQAIFASITAEKDSLDSVIIQDYIESRLGGNPNSLTIIVSQS